MRSDRPPLSWLTDALTYAREACQLAHDRQSQELERRDYLAIRYCLMVVGEALYWVEDEILASEPDVPWKRVVGLRHRLVHGYWLIDEDILMEIARNEVEPLMAALTRIVQKLK